MKRKALKYLIAWKTSPDRKPVLIRGARQVGKSYLVRQLAQEFSNFVEVNFELEPTLKSLFEKDLDPRRIVRDLCIKKKCQITEGQTLLFLDEIQQCPNAVTALRYFYEKLPGLHVIGAGSLLEFALDKIGIPVGRVISHYLFPMSFLEFLDAVDQSKLKEALENHAAFEQMPSVFHDELLDLMGQYLAVGGMPEAVRVWAEIQDLNKCSEIHYTLIDTFRQDFAKYARKHQVQYLETVFDAVPRMLGKKFVFVRVASDLKSRELRPALELLSKAGIVHLVCHSAANGVPLGAEVNLSLFKVIFLDVALAQTILGLEKGEWILDPFNKISNMGPLIEALVGQEILAYGTPSRKKELYYWVRETKGSTAELDYVCAENQHVIPVEVKSGKTGRLKSLHLFLESKKHCPYGVQIYQGNFSKEKRLVRVPIYAVSKALRHSSAFSNKSAEYS